MISARFARFARLSLSCYIGCLAIALFAATWADMSAAEAAIFGFHMALCAVAFVMAQVSSKDLK